MDFISFHSFPTFHTSSLADSLEWIRCATENKNINEIKHEILLNVKKKDEQSLLILVGYYDNWISLI